MLLKIITPEKVVHQAKVKQVSLPTPGGQITVLENHDDVISLLSVGSVVTDGETVAVAGGMVQICNNEVKVLADVAERNEELSEDLVERVKVRAKELMKTKGIEAADFAHFAGQLQKELADMTRSKKTRHKHIGRGAGRPEPENVN